MILYVMSHASPMKPPMKVNVVTSRAQLPVEMNVVTSANQLPSEDNRASSPAMFPAKAHVVLVPNQVPVSLFGVITMFNKVKAANANSLANSLLPLHFKNIINIATVC